MIKVHVELSSKPNKDGRYALFLRVTQNRRHKRIMLGAAVSNRDFNPRAKNGSWIRTSNSKHKVINDLIKKKMLEMEERFWQMESEGKHPSLTEVILPTSPGINMDFFAFTEKLIKRFADQGQYRTAEKRKHLLNKVERFHGSRILPFHAITVSFVKDYETWLHTIGNKQNTIHTDLKIIKSIINNSISEGLLPMAKNPFLSYRLKTEKTFKERLSLLEIDRIKRLTLDEGSRLWHVRNFFLFSFFCGGIRFGDLAMLKWTNIDDTILTYTMAKTEGSQRAYRRIRLKEVATSILDHYSPPGDNGSKFIFPLLNPDLDESDIPSTRRQISSKNAIVNLALKELAKLAGINKRLTFHTARHTFADIARKTDGVSIYDVSKALGHSSLKITEAYVESLDIDSVDSVFDKMFGNE